jgi:dihydroorotate dehydrogenase
VIYRLFFTLVLRRLDPEVAHSIASRALRAATGIPGLGGLIRRMLAPRDPRREVRALGRTFPTPLGVAAGVDKDASWFDGLGALGFGHVEVGTVTAAAQEGNPRPRVFRLVRDRALLNRMGFPNPGADVVAERLRRRGGAPVVGVNVGKSRVAPVEEAGADHRAAVQRLAPFADYLVVNVSSPNTPGLRGLQDPELLGPLVGEVRAELEAVGANVPLLVKIGPDLDDDQIDAIADLAVALGLDGIVAVNTTADRGGLATSRDAAGIGDGGVSGAPLRARALEVLRRLHSRVGDDVVLVSVGGIETPDDAWERILAGATLIQAYTGFVYGGPGWPRRINRALSRRAREAGVRSIQELVGAGPGDPDRAEALWSSSPAT